MATEQLQDSIQRPTTVRFSDDQRQDGERIARQMGLKFSDIVRLALHNFIRHEDKSKTED